MSSYINTKHISNDNVYPEVRINEMSSATGYETLSNVSRFIVSNDKIVNVVSDQYGLLDNRSFFPKVEEKLKAENLVYKIDSKNFSDCRFKVNYILEQNEQSITKGDEIVPMVSCLNTYDGSGRASVRFGIYRKVCSNGLHIADKEIGIVCKHRGAIEEVMIPKIDKFLAEFINEEYHLLQRKFEVLAEKKIDNIEDFVERVCGVSELFKFYSSEKTLTQSERAVEVMSIMQREMNSLKVDPNLWLGYNAFNEVIHNHERSFNIANKKDKMVFDIISNMS
jgi:hypothetical protein